jgi:hypothetical protein
MTGRQARALLVLALSASGAGGCGGAVDVSVYEQHAPEVDASRFSDKVVVGYQGWFAAEGDGSPANRWMHWSPGGAPARGHVTFEIFPDTREFPQAALFDTALAPLGDGRPARLYGAARAEVVDTHFRWMEDAGIDGAALQRFLGDLRDPGVRAFRDVVAGRVRDAAEAHGRIFYLEYDISGANDATWVDDLVADYDATIAPLTASPRYAREGSRPVLAVWGPGFPDRPGSAAQAADCAQRLKARGLYVIVGVPYGWRTGDGSKPGFLDAWAQYDMIQPWSVGAYATDADVKSHYDAFIVPDKQWAQSRGVAYQRVIFPGFAWSNWNGGARNMIPRRAGAMLWHQAYYVRQAGLSAFIAMFDEFDEGTAIAKAAEDASMIPGDQYFLTLDADGTRLSSDFYLRLAGAATNMIEGRAPLAFDVPIPTNGPAPQPNPNPDPNPNPQPSSDPVPAQHAATGAARTWDDAHAQAIVARCYRALLGRDADASGLGAYTPLVASGRLRDFTSALAMSGEFDARRPSLTAAGLASELYRALLDRDGDPSGLASTADAIRQAQLAARAADMILSPEYAASNP